jgi:hypothetical protein
MQSKFPSRLEGSRVPVLTAGFISQRPAYLLVQRLLVVGECVIEFIVGSGAPRISSGSATPIGSRTRSTSYSLDSTCRGIVWQTGILELLAGPTSVARDI